MIHVAVRHTDVVARECEVGRSPDVEADVQLRHLHDGFFARDAVADQRERLLGEVQSGESLDEKRLFDGARTFDRGRHLRRNLFGHICHRAAEVTTRRIFAQVLKRKLRPTQQYTMCRRSNNAGGPSWLARLRKVVVVALL